ncbi:unnamed protein product, partial [Didymodactylos carnosus]
KNVNDRKTKTTTPTTAKASLELLQQLHLTTTAEAAAATVFTLTTPSHQSPVSATFNDIISLQRKKLKSDQDETTEPELIITANNNIMKNNDNQLNMSPTNQPSVQLGNVEKIDLTEEHQTNSVILIEKSGNEMMYSPPNDQWMADRLADLKLFRTRNRKNILNYATFGKTQAISVNTKPFSIKSIQPDGNCFFRGLSYTLTGSEEYHAEFRNLVISQIRLQNYTNYGKDEYNHLTADEYIKKSKVNRLGVFSCEKEIFAACDLLKCEIYIYQSERNLWIKFKPVYSQVSGSMAIYLRRNNNKNHFDVVLDIEPGSYAT